MTVFKDLIRPAGGTPSPAEPEKEEASETSKSFTIAVLKLTG